MSAVGFPNSLGDLTCTDPLNCGKIDEFVSICALCVKHCRICAQVTGPSAAKSQQNLSEIFSLVFASFIAGIEIDFLGQSPRNGALT